jgi:hypothetical protein
MGSNPAQQNDRQIDSKVNYLDLINFGGYDNQRDRPLK